MTSIHILTSSDSEDWDQYLNRIKDADIYFTAEYCRIYEKNHEGLAQLFVYEEGEHLICYPYLLRKINELNLPAVTAMNKDLYDIVTPYGYGGPLTNIHDHEERQNVFQRFNQIFGEYCRDHNIVSEFVRFHPIIRNHEYYQVVEPEMLQNTVSIELSANRDEIMDSLKNKCRNRLKYAIRHELIVTKEEPDNLEVLMEQYSATMKKNNANSYYFFDEEFFKNTVELLENHIDLFSVKFDGKVIASALFLHYNGFVSYHLTGSDKEYLTYAPYNILIYEAACYYGKKGYKTLHLGGGYLGNEDELFRFKKTFTKKSLHEFYVGRKVHCTEIYRALTEHLDVPQDYFPLYRHPKLVNAMNPQLLKTQ